MTEKKSARSDKGVSRLTERDMVTLAWVGGQYCVRFDTLQKLLGRMPGESSNDPAEEGKINARNTRRVVNRWQELGLVKYRKFFYREPGWVWLTNKGLAEVGLPYRLYTPTAASLNHFHVINELRLWLENRYGERLTWTGERELRRIFEQMPADERQRKHLTDADITVDGQLVGVEVELTQKSRRRLVDIVDKLRVQYSGVWYFVDDTTEPVIKRAVGESGKFKVYNLKQVLGQG